MKKILLIGFLVLAHNLFAQNWEVYYSDDDVKIEYTLHNFKDDAHGIDHQRLIFRYTNLSDKNLQVQFQRKLAYDNVELDHTNERSYSLDIAAGEMKQFDQTNNSKTYYIFSSDNKGTIKRKLSAFELNHVTTTEK